MGIITIELTEDFRGNFGNRGGSSIDEEVFYDAFGFPYFPAWVIRNTLYAAAEEVLGEEERAAIFGDGQKAGALRMENAIIGYRESMKCGVIALHDNRIAGLQPVLRKFTKVGKFYRDGQEKTARLLNRGLIFEQCIRLDPSYRQALEKLLAKCRCLQGGTGRIKLEADWERGENEVYGTLDKRDTYPSDGKVFGDTDACRLYYSLKLLSPVCISEAWDTSYETRTYIPGELLLRALPIEQEKEKRIKASYAFSEIGGKRSEPVSIAFSVLKTDRSALRDRLSSGRRPDDYDQISRLSELYTDGTGKEEVTSRSVEREYGTVRFLGPEGEKTVSYHAIRPEQVMRGFFEGPAEVLSEISNALKKDPYLKLGSLTDAGLGLCRIEPDERLDTLSEENEDAGEIRAELLSPAALRLGNGLYTDTAEALLLALRRLYGIDDLVLVSFLRETRMVQGYTPEWPKTHQVMYLMKEGSSFRVKSESGKRIPVGQETVFIGDFTADGFGEVRITPMEDHYYRKMVFSPFSRYDAAPERVYDPKPGKQFIRALREEHAKKLALALGQADGEDFYRVYYRKARGFLDTLLDYEPDEQMVMERYLQGIQEACRAVQADREDEAQGDEEK